MKKIIIILILIFINIGFAKTQSGTKDLKKSVELFTDNFIQYQVKQNRIPGAFVAVVKEDNVLIQRSYGYGNVATKTPMDIPGRLYKIASISKAFTNMAIIKLADEGRINLDEDIQKYLPNIEIAKTYQQPITVADLLSHTEGFEEYYIENIIKEEDESPGLLDYLQRNKSARIYPPGAELTYGSYATFYLGRIIETVSGQYFSEYMDAAFFKPLNLQNASFTQPIPQHIRPKLSNEYININGIFEEAKLIYPVTPPAGSAYMSGDDIVTFLKLLNDECREYLSKKSFGYVANQQFTPHPNIAGMTHAFFGQEINGHKAITRNGDGAAFRSTVFYFPQEKISFFLYYNVDDNKVRNEFIYGLSDILFPVKKVDKSSQIPVNLKEFEGTYKPIQSAKKGIAKIQIMFVGKIKLYQEDDSSITIDPGPNGDVYGGFEEKMKFYPTDNDIFTTENGKFKIALFEENGKPKIASGFGYHGVFTKTTIWENPILQLIIIAIWLIPLFIVLLYFLYKIILFIINVFKGGKIALPGISNISVPIIILAVLSLTYTIGVNYLLIIGDGSSLTFNIPAYFLKLSPAINIFTKIPWIIIIAAIFFGFSFWSKNRKSGNWNSNKAIKLFLVFAIQFIFLWQHWYWNLW